jgi:SAM-dependent methyltransferase
VIDIGTATGFFAFECEKRGAGPVVATELRNMSEWDIWANRVYEGVDIPRENWRDCKEAHELLGSRVELYWGSINDPIHEELGTFDFVVFGSLMTHLRDLMHALGNVYRLTKGRAIVISSYMPSEEKPVLHLSRGERPNSWWTPSKTVVPLMLKGVGYKKVEEVGDFVLLHKNGLTQNQCCWHAYP